MSLSNAYSSTFTILLRNQKFINEINLDVNKLKKIPNPNTSNKTTKQYILIYAKKIIHYCFQYKCGFSRSCLELCFEEAEFFQATGMLLSGVDLRKRL